MGDPADSKKSPNGPYPRLRMKSTRKALTQLAGVGPYFSVAFAISAVAAIYWSTGLPDDEHDFFEYLCWFLVGGAMISVLITLMAGRALPDGAGEADDGGSDLPAR